ncbi:thymidylate synthase [Roseibium sp. RKSG952]|uniref:thymidylate synthase n=1 Tax=Roseibium sp. RKSG952 TaxID=2529384 RepID=UPI0012BCF71F|nr:thymidylate synthase [Roseibium sp. RKSG952]MTH94816.1 thymidylate synthase [Roseibium sp. RKSG952]
MITLNPANAEHQYLELLKRIRDRGDARMDRTGVGTRALFGEMMKFDLSDGTVPIFTTKKVLWKVALKELIWMLSGGTNIRELVKQNVTIWTDWPLKRYREETGDEIDRKEFERRVAKDDAFAAAWGELGPVYGSQWRAWQAPDGSTYDQISDCIEQLRNNPASRRIIFHGWNVPDLPSMALPPCHLLYQFGVSAGKLNLIMYQRSVDTVLGLPFNIASCSFLLRMVADQVDLQPGTLTWFGGDTHLYDNHHHVLDVQLDRTPNAAPKLNLLRKPGSLFDYVPEDFELVGYEPQGFIKADVAI